MISRRDTTKFAASAMPSTEAIASDATTHVDPHNSANWMIAFVSRSMKPAPSRKNCHDHAPRPPGPGGSAHSVAKTAMTENARIIAITAA